MSGKKSTYISKVCEQIEHQEKLLSSDRMQDPKINDHAWDGEYSRTKITNRNSQ